MTDSSFYSKKSQEEFNPKFLDIVKRQNELVIHYGSDTLKSLGGIELSHQSPRFLEHIVRDLSIRAKSEPNSLNGFAAFCYQKDYVETKKDPIAKNFSTLFKNDPFIKVKFRRDEQDDTEANMSILDFLDNTKVTISFLFGCLNSMMKRLNDYFLSKYRVSDFGEEEFEGRMRKFFNGEYLDLKDEEKSAMYMLCMHHDAGFILPYMLLKGMVTPSEYSNVLFSINLPYQKDKNAVSFAELIAEREMKLFKPDWDYIQSTYGMIRNQAVTMLEYASYEYEKNRDETKVDEYIAKGEGEFVEFKSTLRWNIHTGKKDPKIEHAALKSIAAFLNSGGGHLFIGINDEGESLNLEMDGFPNTDKFLLHIWNLVKQNLGTEAGKFIRTNLHTLNGKMFCHVSCSRSSDPVFVDQKGFDEVFYIRTGPATTKLSISETMNYIKGRFKGFSI
jgi:schlafen family protein